jgi:hypothetical protein
VSRCLPFGLVGLQESRERAIFRPVAYAILVFALGGCLDPSRDARILHADVHDDARRVTLALDSCDADNRVIVEEHVRRVVVTVVTKGTGKQLEGCSDAVVINLQRPLTGRLLIDANTGKTVKSTSSE